MTHEYIGTKIVTAWPSEKDGKPGYGVKYADGYISWSPKEAFDAAYVDIGHVAQLPDYQQRVIGEKALLDDKLGKLKTFFETERFKALTGIDQALMTRQALAMADYSETLGLRITAFNA